MMRYSILSFILSFSGTAFASPSSDWKHAQNLYRAGNYKEAAAAFYTLSRKSPLPKVRRQSKFYLGVSLYKQGLRQIASFPLTSLVKIGEGSEKQKSMDYIVVIADQLGEPSLLNYAINHIRPDELSETSKAVFYSRLGDVALRQGDTKKAETAFLNGLETKRFENKMLYSLGLTALMANNPGKAVGYFNQFYERVAKKPVTNLERGLAILGQARSFYQGKRWKEAVELYRQIPKDHLLYRESLMELSWALFRSGQFRSALSPLQTLHTPFYANYYDPESLMLHSMILLFICHHEEIEPVMDSFDKNYYPAFGKIQEWLNSPRADAEYYEQILKTRQALKEIKKNGKAKTETELPFFVMRTLLEDPEISVLTEYLEKIKLERKKLEKAYKGTTLFSYGKQILEGRRKNVQADVGNIIKNKLIAKYSEFQSFATQSEFLKYEILNGKRIALKKKISENEPETETQIDQNLSRDYYVQNGYQFWPFEGEYWRDEIGNYQYVGVQRCE